MQSALGAFPLWVWVLWPVYFPFKLKPFRVLPGYLLACNSIFLLSRSVLYAIGWNRCISCRLFWGVFYKLLCPRVGRNRRNKCKVSFSSFPPNARLPYAPVAGDASFPYIDHPKGRFGQVFSLNSIGLVTFYRISSSDLYQGFILWFYMPDSL